MKSELALCGIILIAVNSAMAQDPRDAYKGQEQAALDAPPPAPRGSLYLQRAQPTEADAGMDPSQMPRATSYIEVTAAPKKTYRKHDIVTIVISEDSESSTTGQAETKKTQDFDTAIQQFLKLGSTNAGVPSVQQQNNPSVLPEVKFSYNNDRKNDATQGRKDSFSGRIAAEVVDVKPNGTLVLEATKQIQNDKEVQLFRLTGICKAESITGGSVISTEIAELSLTKSTTGEVRDGTKRGWLNGALDKISPF